MRKFHSAVAATTVMAALAAVAATGASAAPVRPGSFELLCTPTDPELEELSGMTFVDGRLFAIGDSGTDDFVFELGSDCAVERKIPVPIDPYDVEDLAAVGSSLVLADTGDNRRSRETVAVITMDPDGDAGTLHRLTYPDGPHDAESIFVDDRGQIFIVTKELFGRSGVYTSADRRTLADLAEPGPSALERIGDVRTGTSSGSTGGGFDSVIFTGGAVSHDGSVLALRSYSDVYLYEVLDNDVGATLTSRVPVKVATPSQPQGEAVAFTDAGDLLIASESAGGPLPPVYVMRAVVGSTDTSPVAVADESTRQSTVGYWAIGGAALAVIAFGTVGVLVSRRRGN